MLLYGLITGYVAHADPGIALCLILPLLMPKPHRFA